MSAGFNSDSDIEKNSKTSLRENDEVLFETVNGKGIITLNRPKQLNAFTRDIFRRISAQLQEWEPTIHFVILKGAGGRAFSAGGDLVTMTKDLDYHCDTCAAGYKLGVQIADLKVPLISLIDGVVMGGAVGVAVQGRYRVATERTLLGIPEVGVGHIPDLGSSFYLPRLRHVGNRETGQSSKLGLFLALTARKLNGSDALAAGFATHMCASSSINALENELLNLEFDQDKIEVDSSKNKKIEAILSKFHDNCADAQKPFSLQGHLERIDRIFSAGSVEGIFQNLETDAESNLPGADRDWSVKVLGDLNAVSPTALKLAFRLLEEGSRSDMDLRECVRKEYRVSVRVGQRGEIREGVRALLVDKDKNPKWEPSLLAQVTRDFVNSFFAPLSDRPELNV